MTAKELARSTLMEIEAATTRNLSDPYHQREETFAIILEALRTHGEAEHARGYAAGQEAMRERASEGAAGFSTQQHVAHSIKEGVFPEQTDIREAIAAAIRVLSIEPAPAARPRRHVTAPLDGFTGDVIGTYITREGKRGVTVQQDGTRVVHVYGEARVVDTPVDPEK